MLFAPLPVLKLRDREERRHEPWQPPPASLRTQLLGHSPGPSQGCRAPALNPTGIGASPGAAGFGKAVRGPARSARLTPKAGGCHTARGSPRWVWLGALCPIKNKNKTLSVPAHEVSYGAWRCPASPAPTLGCKVPYGRGFPYTRPISQHKPCPLLGLPRLQVPRAPPAPASAGKAQGELTGTLPTAMGAQPSPAGDTFWQRGQLEEAGSSSKQVLVFSMMAWSSSCRGARRFLLSCSSLPRRSFCLPASLALSSASSRRR